MKDMLLDKIDAPSGRVFERKDILLAISMDENKFIRYSDQPNLLNCGAQSRFYIGGREDLTDNIRFELMIGQEVAAQVARHSQNTDKQACLIGVPTAGNVIAQAAAMASAIGDFWKPPEKTICHRLMRENRKGHGRHRGWVNGEPETGKHTYWLADNVITSGASMLIARERVMQSGYPVAEMPCLILVDRESGGVRRLEKDGCKRIVIVYYLLDLVFVLCELKRWPKTAFQELEQEIKNF